MGVRDAPRDVVGDPLTVLVGVCVNVVVPDPVLLPVPELVAVRLPVLDPVPVRLPVLVPLPVTDDVRDDVSVMDGVPDVVEETVPDRVAAEVADRVLLPVLVGVSAAVRVRAADPDGELGRGGGMGGFSESREGCRNGSAAQRQAPHVHRVSCVPCVVCTRAHGAPLHGRGPRKNAG